MLALHEAEAVGYQAVYYYVQCPDGLIRVNRVCPKKKDDLEVPRPAIVKGRKLD